MTFPLPLLFPSNQIMALGFMPFAHKNISDVMSFALKIIMQWYLSIQYLYNTSNLINLTFP